MTNVLIAGQSFPGYNYGGTTAKIRIYPSEKFTASDGTIVGGATLLGNTTGFFFTLNCTVANNVLTSPSISLPSTTDSMDEPSVTYTAVLFDWQGAKRDFFPLSDFAIPHTIGATTTWGALAAYNAGRPLYRMPGYLDADQTAALINSAVNVGNPATVGAIGRSRASVAPVDPAVPIFMGDNDPRASSGVTVYAARFPGATIAAQINAADAGITSLGASSGTIIVEGGGELGHPTNPALSLVAPSENRVIKLGAGVYTNSHGWAAPFRLASNTTVEGVGDATIIKQVAAATSNESLMVFVPVNSYTTGGVNSRTPSKNIHVRNLQIDGTDGTGYTASSGAVNLGNTHGASVLNVLFTNVRGFAVQVGGSAETAGTDPDGLGYFASNVLVDGCTVTGCQSQNIAVVNAKRVIVSYCNLLRPDATNQSQSMIDVEPAEASAVLEDIAILDNVVDARGRTGGGAVNGIQVQGVPLGVIAKRVTVRDNRVIGGEDASATAMTIGISLSGSTIGTRIENNTVWGVASAGVLTYSTGTHSHATISDNYVRNCGSSSTDNYAMSLGGLTYSFISDNRIFHNPAVAGNSRLQEQANSDYNIFQDNVHFGNSSDAFTLTTGANSRSAFTNEGGNRFFKNLFPTQNGGVLGTVGAAWVGTFTDGGVRVQSPNGTLYKIKVANDGTLSTQLA